MEGRNNFLCWEQVSGARGEESNWSESMRTSSSAPVSSSSRLKNRASPQASPASLSELESSNMETSQPIGSSTVSQMNRQTNVICPTVVGSGEGINNYHSLVNPSSSVYGASCYPVSHSLYDPYPEPRYGPNAVNAASVSHLYNPSGPNMNYPLPGAPAPSMPSSNSICTSFDDSRPWSQGSGSSLASEGSPYEYQGVIHHAPQTSLLSNTNHNLTAASTNLNGIHHIQNSHQISDHNIPDHSNINQQVNNNSVSTGSNHPYIHSPVMYNVDYFACEKYYHDKNLADKNLYCDKNLGGVDKSQQYSDKDQNCQSQLAMQVHQYNVPERSDSILSTSSESSPIHKSKHCDERQNSLPENMNSRIELSSCPSSSRTPADSNSIQANASQQHCSEATFSSCITSSSACLRNSFEGNFSPENQVVAGEATDGRTQSTQLHQQDSNSREASSTENCHINRERPPLLNRTCPGGLNPIQEHDQPASSSVLQSVVSTSACEPPRTNPQILTMQSNECAVISNLNGSNLNGSSSVNSLPVSTNLSSKQPLQPGYTSVIVDAQQYHMTHNEYVH